jgi:hypothetical protein
MISERYIIPYIMNILSLKKYITLISYHNGVILFGVISQHTYIYIYMYYVYTFLIYPKQFLRKLLGSLGLQSILYITIRMYIYNMIYPHLYMVYIDTRYRYIYICISIYILYIPQFMYPILLGILLCQADHLPPPPISPSSARVRPEAEEASYEADGG